MDKWPSVRSKILPFARLTATGVVSNVPCLVYSICGIGLAQASNVYTIYDGQNAEGKVKLRLTAGAYSSDFRRFEEPLYFAKGLYIAFTTNGEEVTVQYFEVDE